VDIISFPLVFPGFQGQLGKQGPVADGCFKRLGMAEFVPEIKLKGMQGIFE
jgi:hypothetical protein